MRIRKNIRRQSMKNIRRQSMKIRKLIRNEEQKAGFYG
jgi:hypothetical protein